MGVACENCVDPVVLSKSLRMSQHQIFDGITGFIFSNALVRLTRRGFLSRCEKNAAHSLRRMDSSSIMSYIEQWQIIK